jgi:Zn finger protein HypA/HybF involved in hydrogenase expression
MKTEKTEQEKIRNLEFLGECPVCASRDVDWCGSWGNDAESNDEHYCPRCRSEMTITQFFNGSPTTMDICLAIGVSEVPSP